MQNGDQKACEKTNRSDGEKTGEKIRHRQEIYSYFQEIRGRKKTGDQKSDGEKTGCEKIHCQAAQEIGEAGREIRVQIRSKKAPGKNGPEETRAESAREKNNR